MTAKFIVIEGIEGAGKSSAVATCKTFFEQHQLPLTCTREPGGTPCAEALREIVKQPWQETVTAETELLIMYAARNQLLANTIKPALQSGSWVLGDRHDLSTQAYQGGGRQIPQQTIDAVRMVALGDFKPSHTLYLDVSAEEGLQRARGRGELDRIEQEHISFFERTRERYLALAAKDESIVVINAMQDMHKVQSDIVEYLEQWIA